jgi:hypothetical protein
VGSVNQPTSELVHGGTSRGLSVQQHHEIGLAFREPEAGYQPRAGRLRTARARRNAPSPLRFCGGSARRRRRRRSRAPRARRQDP